MDFRNFHHFHGDFALLMGLPIDIIDHQSTWDFDIIIQYAKPTVKSLLLTQTAIQVEWPKFWSIIRGLRHILDVIVKSID